VIQHVALEVRPRDGEACMRFWELLGFAAVAAPPSLGARAGWLQRGATQVHLLFVEDPVVAPEGHVAVVVEDYDATLAALRAAGLEPESRTEHWGSPRCFVRCPAGHRVEIMAFAPGPAAPG
jgi:catechol 2,3-dioxygenase-like lactoylglutathione lyase family enzyme